MHDLAKTFQLNAMIQPVSMKYSDQACDFGKCLFLIYPSVSSTVLRLYVCKDIGTKSFLLADLRVECHTDKWYMYSYGSLLCVLLYPIGIPCFFFVVLWTNRESLQDPNVKNTIGFLYDGYRKKV
jgi:hypothetical protein